MLPRQNWILRYRATLCSSSYFMSKHHQHDSGIIISHLSCHQRKVLRIFTCTAGKFTWTRTCNQIWVKSGFFLNLQKMKIHLTSTVGYKRIQVIFLQGKPSNSEYECMRCEKMLTWSEYNVHLGIIWNEIWCQKRKNDVNWIQICVWLIIFYGCSRALAIYQEFFVIKKKSDSNIVK